MKTKTKIILEKRERRTIRLFRPKFSKHWCEHCVDQVEVFVPAEAALILGITQLAVFRKIESRELHFIETRTGGLLICGNSLEAKNQNY